MVVVEVDVVVVEVVVEEVDGGALRKASSISASVSPFPRRNSRLLSSGEPWTLVWKKRRRKKKRKRLRKDSVVAGDEGKEKKKRMQFVFLLAFF